MFNHDDYLTNPYDLRNPNNVINGTMSDDYLNDPCDLRNPNNVINGTRNIFPGNQSEQTTLKPLETQIILDKRTDITDSLHKNSAFILTMNLYQKHLTLLCL